MKKHKHIGEFSISAPKQGQLFELASLYGSRSHTIEIYDQANKYYFGAQKDRVDGKYLPPLKREFEHRKTKYHITVHAATIIDRYGQERAYYPSQREEIIEDAIRKIATQPDRLSYLDDQASVIFSFQEVRRALEAIGHGYSISEIQDAVNILGGSVMILESEDQKVSLQSTFFTSVGLSERGTKEKKAFVRFHPLVTKSINDASFRMINYEKSMGLKLMLARWLYKRMSHIFIQANVAGKPYNIKLTTIIRDSGIKRYERLSAHIIQIKEALEMLVREDVLQKYEMTKIFEKTNKQKLEDVLLELFVSKEFESDIIKANRCSRNNIGSSVITLYKEDDADLIVKLTIKFGFSAQEAKDLLQQYGAAEVSKIIVSIAKYLDKVSNPKQYLKTVLKGEKRPEISTFSKKQIVVEINQEKIIAVLTKGPFLISETQAKQIIKTFQKANPSGTEETLLDCIEAAKQHIESVKNIKSIMAQLTTAVKDCWMPKVSAENLIEKPRGFESFDVSCSDEAFSCEWGAFMANLYCAKGWTTFASWFSKLKFEKRDVANLVMSCQNNFVRETIVREHHDTLMTALKTAAPNLSGYQIIWVPD